MTAGNWISLFALLVSLYVVLTNGKKDTRGNAEREARTEAKLDNISSGVTEIRVELRSMRDELKDHGQRLVAVEASAKSAHHRMDELERLVHAMHPPEKR